MKDCIFLLTWKWLNFDLIDWQEFVTGNELMKSMIPALFSQLLVFAGFACQAPTFGQMKTKSINTFKGMQVNFDGRWIDDKIDLIECMK